MLRIVLLGQPGIGKGTAAKILSEKFNLPHIIASDVLKELAANGDEDAKQAKQLMEEGTLVPDDLINAIMEKRFSLSDTQSGFIVDGYPRTLEQVSVFHSFTKVEGVLLFHAERKIVLDRISTRLVKEGRKDDSPEITLHRMDEFEKKTRPVIDYYYNEKLITEIDASKTIEEVAEQCSEAIRRMQNGG